LEVVNKYTPSYHEINSQHHFPYTPLFLNTIFHKRVNKYTPSYHEINYVPILTNSLKPTTLSNNYVVAQSLVHLQCISNKVTFLSIAHFGVLSGFPSLSYLDDTKSNIILSNEFHLVPYDTQVNIGWLFMLDNKVLGLSYYAFILVSYILS